MFSRAYALDETLPFSLYRLWLQGSCTLEPWLSVCRALSHVDIGLCRIQYAYKAVFTSMALVPAPSAVDLKFTNAPFPLRIGIAGRCILHCPLMAIA